MSAYAESEKTWEQEWPEEFTGDMNGTKWKIFCCAVHYFAEYDYSSISMRQLAEQVGIRAASIYNHFASKEDILVCMYQYMERYMNVYMPDLDHLLERTETEEPQTVLQAAYFHYPDYLQQMLSKMILICSKMMRTDAEADRILREMLIEIPGRYIRTLLRVLIDKKRILPVDIDVVTELFINNFYGASLRMYSSHPVGDDIWLSSFEFLIDSVCRRP